ncbi:MAG: hypothetical protein OXI24_08625 [Candidatus Poribacteria bacterium]|nr:hypothetical protein [Candidatus Poribacteria bacterium]
MLMEIDTQVRSIVPGLVPGTSDTRDQSGALHEDLHLFTDDLGESFAASGDAVSRRYKPLPGREKKRSDSRTFLQGSFAISNEVLSLEKEIVEFVIKWFKEVSDNAQLDTGFDMLVDVEVETAEQELIDEREQMRLANKLHAAFETEPLEDGMHHKAEDIIEQALQSDGDERILKWLREFSSDDTQPVFAASVLRCLGRLEYPRISLWRSELVRDALALDDVEIRDAAVQATELWGDRHILPVLKSHSEPESWLRDYISDVIDDLGE